jgi:hypothetical protein
MGISKENRLLTLYLLGKVVHYKFIFENIMYKSITENKKVRGKGNILCGLCNKGHLRNVRHLVTNATHYEKKKARKTD